MKTCQDKLIFLDIDGVVNTLQINDTPFESITGKINRDGFYFEMCSSSDKRVSNKQAILWLSKLCLETGSKIVISSSWRNDMPLVIESLYNSGLCRRIEIIGATDHLGTIRGEEIEKFIKQYSVEPKYVILDDDSDMGNCISHLVLCDTYHGFGYTEFLKAKSILND